MRIVSLVPAGTDIVCDLGLESSLVGISHECDATTTTSPPRLTRSLVATETMTSAEIDAAVSARAEAGAPMYDIDIEQLLALEPDLVISQSLCDVCALPADAVAQALADAAPRVPLYSLDGSSIDAMLQSIIEIGRRTECTGRARRLVADLQARLDRVAAAVSQRERPRVVCLEWLDPPYACGHWIPEMVDRAGGVDLLGRRGIPSIPTPWSDIERVRPPVVIAMPCGYDLARAIEDVGEASRGEAWQQALGDARVFAAAGGAYFTRPGPKLVTGIEVIAAVLHPDVATWDVPDGAIEELSRV